MIELRNWSISSDGLTIDALETTIRMDADADCGYIGCLRLGNGAVRSFGFVKVGSLYAGRLRLSPDDEGKIGDASFYVLCVDSMGSHETNRIGVTFDPKAFAESVDLSYSKEILALRRDMAKLEATLSKVASNKSVGTFKLADGKAVSEGMIPVSVGGDRFVASYPLADIVRSVNGQTSPNGTIEIDAGMIEYAQGITVRAFGDRIAAAFDALQDEIATVSETLKSLAKRVDGLEVRLLTHLDSGII